MTRREAESLLTSSALPLVSSMARKFSRRISRLHVDDLVQVGLIAVWDTLPKHDACWQELHPLLRRVVFCAFVEYSRNYTHPLGWRYNRARKNMPVADPVADEHTKCDTRELDDAEEFDRLIRPLGSREKAVVRMIFCSELTHREVAGELQCSEGTVQNLFNRAMAAMRKRWA